jgi:hypothetical protein
MGLTVDDDPELVEQNLPKTSNNFMLDPSTGLYHGQKWDWDGHCQ